MADYGRSPDVDAREILKECILTNERSAMSLLKDIDEERAKLDQRAAKAAEFRAANETLRAQLAILEKAGGA